MSEPFWKTKPLNQFTESEWESICTHCGHCCQIKLQDDQTEDIYFTDIVCRYFDTEKCCCTEYDNRCTLVPTCLKLTPNNLDSIPWMPEVCAYRILKESGELPSWHPLITKAPLAESLSVKGKVISELLVDEEEWEDHIIEDE